MPADTTLTAAERDFLLGLQRQALQYFLDNQAANGLILDRQANHEPLRPPGWCSTSATGMGLVALALASAEPYGLLTSAEAVARVGSAVRAALEHLPEDHGMMPHFIDAESGAVVGSDVVSTVDSSWLVAGALWAAAFLHESGLEAAAQRLYERVDWHYWTAPELPDSHGLLRHGKTSEGQFLGAAWDRLDGEVVHMYVLGAGAAPGRELSPGLWTALRCFCGTVAGLYFTNADLGLFAFQYGLDLLDLGHWRPPAPPDLMAEGTLAARANYLFCRHAAGRFATYHLYWGLSDGDAPGIPPQHDAYRSYGPGRPLDGTAHLTATLASVAHAPELVLHNLYRADRHTALGARGRYGFSPVNLDHHWVGRDMVGIDAGAAVLAVDNYLMDDRVRRVFGTVPCVVRGFERLGFTIIA
jgi:hypothetical protein